MKTFEVADPDCVAEMLEKVIKHTGKLINRSKTINGEHLQKLAALANSYTRLMLTSAKPESGQTGEYEALLGTDEDDDA